MTTETLKQALVALETGRSYVEAELKERMDLYDGYGELQASKTRAEREDLAELDAAIASLQASLAAPPDTTGRVEVGAVPEGWKLVPVEPTPRMLFEADRILGGEPHILASLYRAMLAASPASSVGGPDE